MRGGLIGRKDGHDTPPDHLPAFALQELEHIFARCAVATCSAVHEAELAFVTRFAIALPRVGVVFGGRAQLAAAHGR